MFVCFFLNFELVWLFFFSSQVWFCSISVDCCGMVLMFICIYVRTASSSMGFRGLRLGLGLVSVLKIPSTQQIASKSLTTTLLIKTLHRASMLSSDLQSFMVSICVVLRSPEHALSLVAGKACCSICCFACFI